MAVAPTPKPTWTHDDFESMTWHDNTIHAMALAPAEQWPGTLLIDLDYIVEWTRVDDAATGMGFWISPATLVFDRASDFRCDIDLSGMAFDLQLDRIDRSEPDRYGQRQWTLAGHEFTMSLSAPGFVQHLRRPPVLCEGQNLDLATRGGIDFAAG